MIFNKVLGCIFCMWCGYGALAIGRDSAVTITSSSDEIQFLYNSRAGRVEVKQKSSNTYTSSTYQSSYPISEFYNDHKTIDNISCKVDGRTPKDFSPKFTYYGEDDVFYSDARICYFPITLAKKGILGTVTFSETIDDPRYLTNVYFAEVAPLQHKEVIIKIPRWMKVELKELNFNSYDIKKTTQYLKDDDADLVTYTINNIPAMERETNGPGPTYVYPHLLVLCKEASISGKQFTYFNTVADQYAWYHDLIKNNQNDNQLVAAKAKELTNGLTADMDKIKAIFYYVQDNIRYIAFEDGIAGFKPETADEVLRKKYGDCKGMANLTKALLVSSGYDARLCWLGTNHIAYDYGTPSIAVDNHMICALNFKAKIYYLDATETYLGLNEYAERIQGRQVLVENGDKFNLNKIPVALPSQNLSQESRSVSISGTSLVGKVQHLWKGEDKEFILSGINSIKKVNADEAIKNYLANNNVDYQITNMVISSTSNPDKDFTATYNVEQKNGVNIFSKAYYVDLDNKKELADAAINLAERKHDYWFPFVMNVNVQAELSIPPNYKPSSVPASLNIVNPGYEFHIEYINADGKITYKKTILIKNTHLVKADFAQWNKDVKQLSKTYNETLILKPILE